MIPSILVVNFNESKSKSAFCLLIIEYYLHSVA